MGDHFTRPLKGVLFRKFSAEIMNIPDELDMVDMGMGGKGLKRDITCKLHNNIGPGFPQECVGGCGKVGRGNVAMEYPNVGTHNGTYNAVISDKGERSRAVRSYNDATREDVKTPLGQNRLIIS